MTEGELSEKITVRQPAGGDDGSSRVVHVVSRSTGRWWL